MSGTQARIPFEIRLWSGVEKQSNGCWLWTRATNGFGYGTLRRSGGKQVTAHRASYELLVGPVPDGLDLDHLCRVRNCVNPAHLEPVSRRENLLRGQTIPSRNAAKTHCPNGHELKEGNLVKSMRGRCCRTCFNAAAKARYHAKRNEVGANV